MSLPRLIPCIALIAIFFLSNAEADIYRFRDKEGVWHFSNTRSDARYRLYIRTRGIGGKQYLKKYDDVIRKAAKQFGMEVNLIKAIIKAESSFDPDAVSESGAQGLMQLMPDTANDMEVGNPFDPEENIFGGTRYLSLLLQRFNHDKRLAVAAYNVGATTVTKYDAIPPIPQTRRFVEKVMKYYREFNEKSN
jgi:soluble lytic murein transglycosylase-like protein